jgi:hypothetical protein
MDWPVIVSTASRPRLFEPEEFRQLQRLRQRYQLEPDIFTEREWSKLRFVRWLVQTGRLQPG